MTDLLDLEPKSWNSIRISASLFLVAGSGLLVAGFISADLWYLGVVSMAALVTWVLGLYYGWNWALTLPFVIQSGLVGAGFLLGVPATWLLGGLLFLLGAWDLSIFWMRFRSVKQISEPSILIQKHFLQLIPVLLVGAILASIAIVTQFHLGFGWLAGISLFMMIGLSLGIRRVLRSSN